MFDELYPEQQQNSYRFTATNGLTPQPVKEPGAFAGLGRTVRDSFMQGGAIAARGAGMALSPIVGAFDQKYGPSLNALFGDDRKPLQDQYFDVLDKATLPAINYWKPNPAGTGTASQIAGGLARMLLPLAAGGGNPSLVVAGEQVNAFDELTAQGVDGKTANVAATVRGVTTAAGMMLPAALVSGKLAAAGAGAVANAAIGVTDRAATKAILEYTDYDKIAAQYKPLDGTSLAIDALIGAAGGSVGAALKERAVRVSADQVAAAMVLHETHAMQDASLVKQDHPAITTRESDARLVVEQQIESGRRVSVAHEVPADLVKVQEAQARTMQRMLSDVTLTETVVRALPAEDLAAMRAEVSAAYKTDKSLQTRQNWQTLTDEGIRRTAEAMQKPKDAIEAAPAKAAKQAPEQAAQKVEPLDPIAQLVAANPERMIRMEDGTEVRAADMLAEADASMMQAETDQRAYAAAVNCFISHGGA